MSNKKILVTILSLCVITIALPAACNSPKPPAQFEVTSLDVKPAAIAAGETAVVNAQVTNVGGSAGTYSVTLSVDGKKIDKKDISLDAGYSRSVNFSISKDEAGTYKIGVGERSVTLTVESQLVAKPM